MGSAACWAGSAPDDMHPGLALGLLELPCIVELSAPGTSPMPHANEGVHYTWV